MSKVIDDRTIAETFKRHASDKDIAAAFTRQINGSHTTDNILSHQATRYPTAAEQFRPAYWTPGDPQMPLEFVPPSIRRAPIQAAPPGRLDRLVMAIPIPQPIKDISEFATSHIPAPRTALRVGGAAIGGALGGAGGTVFGTPIAGPPGAAVGGAAGASTGESIYQLMEPLLEPKPPDVPRRTPEEAASEQTGALIQGALQEAIPAWVTSKFPKAIAEGAASNIKQALSPSGAAAKETARELAPKAVGRFPIATSAKSLEGKLGNLSTRANQAVNSAYAAMQQRFPNTQFSTQRIVAALQRERAKWIVRGRPIEGQESRVSQIDDLINNISEDPRLTLNELRAKKVGWDDLINYNRFSESATKDPIKADIHEIAANEARDMIHRAFPALGRADAESHLWNKLSRLAKIASIGQEGQEPLKILLRRYGLASTIGAGIGAGAGFAGGHDPWIGAVAGGLLATIPQTVLWDTMNAAAKAQIIKFLQSMAGAALVKGTSAAAIHEAVKNFPEINISEPSPR